MPSVAVIGAGPAGITAAYQLAKAGLPLQVFEAGDSVGGMSRSFRLWDQTVDLGPHRFFSSDARVNRLWLEVVGRDFQMVDRLTRIYFQDRFFQYPLVATNVLSNLGVGQSLSCVGSYVREQLRPAGAGGAASFEDWVVRRFGRRLFEMFFKTYSEKLWGIPCQEIDADFAAQRIKKLSLGEAVKNALGFGGGRHRTLVDRFAYPTGGSGIVYERMADLVRARGKVHLNRPVARVVHDGERVRGVEVEKGRIIPFDHVISTMPLTLLLKGLANVPAPVQQAANRLQFRNTILVYLQVAATALFPDQWLYVHSADLLTGRVTNFRNWVPQLYGDSPDTILALEYWCYDQDSIWSQSDDELISLATREIRSTGLVGAAQVSAGHVVRLRKSYPVYTRGYKTNLDQVTHWLDRLAGLSVIGRYGAFKYNNQDHSLLMGMLAAENILHRKDHNLWSINTDYESYQESAPIDDSGLAAAA